MVGLVTQSWAKYLWNRGAKAEMAEFPGTWSSFWLSQWILQLDGTNVDEIWAGSEERYIGPFKVTCFRVLFDNPLSPSMRKAVSARTKLIKQGGTVVNVQWIGGSIANSLNQDAGIRMMIVDPTLGGPFNVQIKPEGKSRVSITVSGEVFGGDSFEIFDTIAKHIREYANLPNLRY